MPRDKKACFRCQEDEVEVLENLFGYTVCKACITKLGLYHDQTIKKHKASFERARELNPAKPTYKDEVDYRLSMMEKDYISKRIKLLHIRDRLRNL